MVGGVIERVCEHSDRTTVVVRGADCEHNDVLEIDVEPTKDASVLRTAILLRKGDMIWWQDQVAYWTPANKVFQDVPIMRIGYSRSVRSA